MLFSKSCVYGLRAALYLASNQDGAYTSIKKLSKKLDISFHFLTKILQKLTAEGLLESMKGPNGGVRLAKSGEDISLLDVVAAIDGDELFTRCVLGLPGCGKRKPCPLHATWADMRGDIQQMLTASSLTGMAERGREGNLRITARGDFEWI